MFNIAIVAWSAVPALLQTIAMCRQSLPKKSTRLMWWLSCLGVVVGVFGAVTALGLLTQTVRWPLATLVGLGSGGQVLCLAIASLLGGFGPIPLGFASAITYAFTVPEPALMHWWVLPLSVACAVRLYLRGRQILAAGVSRQSMANTIGRLILRSSENSPESVEAWLAAPEWRLRFLHISGLAAVMGTLVAAVLSHHVVGWPWLIAVVCLSNAQAARLYAVIRHTTRATQRNLLLLWLTIDAAIWIAAFSALGDAAMRVWASVPAWRAGGGLAGFAWLLLVIVGAVLVQLMLALSRGFGRSTTVIASGSAWIRALLSIDRLALFVFLAAEVFHPHPELTILVVVTAISALIGEGVRALCGGGMLYRLDAYLFFNVRMARVSAGAAAPLLELMGSLFSEQTSSRYARFMAVFGDPFLAARNEKVVGSWLRDSVLTRRRPSLRLIRQFSLQALTVATGRGRLTNWSLTAIGGAGSSAAPETIDQADRWLAAGRLLLDLVKTHGVPALAEHRADRLRRTIQDEELARLQVLGMVYQYRGMYDEALIVWQEAVARCREWRPEDVPSFQFTWMTAFMVVGRHAEVTRLTSEWANETGIDAADQQSLLSLGALTAAMDDDISTATELLRRARAIRWGWRSYLRIARRSVRYGDRAPLRYLFAPAGVRVFRGHIYTGQALTTLLTADSSLDAEMAEQAFLGSYSYWDGNDNPARTLYRRGMRLRLSGHGRRAERVLRQTVRRAERDGQYKWVLEALSELARLAFERGRLGPAYYYNSQALSYADGSRDVAISEDLRTYAAAALAPLYERAVLLLYYNVAARRLNLRLPPKRNPWPARPELVMYDIVESAKSRILLELLGNRIADTETTELVAEERDAFAEYDQIRTDLTSRQPSLESLTAVRDARQRLDAVRLRMREAGGRDAEYADLRAGRPLRFEQMQELLTGDTRGSVRAVLCSYFAVSEDTFALLITRADRPAPEIVMLDLALLGIRSAVEQAIANAERRRMLWTDAEGTLATLAPLVAPITEHTEPGDIVLFESHDLLHYLPLHALPVNGRPLAERNPVCYTPNATTLWHCRNRPRPKSEHLLVIADPDGSLPAMRQHQEVITGIFGASHTTVRLGADANRQAVQSSLRDCDGFSVVHFGCHGVFDLADPLSSGLVLITAEDGPTRWSAADFLATPFTAELVVLAACDTGVNAGRAGDELIGLTRSILYAGARSVLVSLWPVDQASTALLLSAFYAELHRGLSKADALRAAQLTVRNTTAEDVVRACRDELARLDDGSTLTSRNWLALRVIRAREAAGDHAEALRECERLATELAVNDPLSSEVRRAAARCRRAVRSPNPPNYQARLYQDTFHWAPFILIGDWR